MFNLSKANIDQIKATLVEYDECYFHGCGNIYADKEASDLRQNFTNPNDDNATYRIHFTSIKQVPSTVEALEKKLLASRSEEIVKNRVSKVSQGVKTVSVPKQGAEPELDETDDEKLQKMIEAENAERGK
jgi:hypothetical protein